MKHECFWAKCSWKRLKKISLTQLQRNLEQSPASIRSEIFGVSETVYHGLIWWVTLGSETSIYSLYLWFRYGQRIVSLMRRSDSWNFGSLPRYRRGWTPEETSLHSVKGFDSTQFDDSFIQGRITHTHTQKKRHYWLMARRFASTDTENDFAPRISF
jgi:hypothetical protein